jgi:hypothetical protein
MKTNLIIVLSSVGVCALLTWAAEQQNQADTMEAVEAADAPAPSDISEDRVQHPSRTGHEIELRAGRPTEPVPQEIACVKAGNIVSAAPGKPLDLTADSNCTGHGERRSN